MTQQSPQWDGQSRAKILGYKFFVFFLNNFGLSPTYFFLRIVSTWYFFFSKPNKHIRDYLIKAHGYSKSKAFWAVYKNNYLFGQTILDKVAVMAGAKNAITTTHPGGPTL